MDASNKNMASADSEEEYSHYDDYEEYTGTGKCKKFINNTSAVKPMTIKKPVVIIKPIKKQKIVEKPLTKQPVERKKMEEEVVDCWEDLL